MLCLIVVPLSPGRNPFAAQLNNNNNNYDSANLKQEVACFSETPLTKISRCHIVEKSHFNIDGRETMQGAVHYATNYPRYREAISKAHEYCPAVTQQQLPLFVMESCLIIERTGQGRGSDMGSGSVEIDVSSE
jgi:hypothetical protein